MLEEKNAHYLILKGLEARWLYLIEEKVDNGKLMAGLDKPRLIFKNNRWDYKPMLPWCIPAIFFGFCFATINMQFVFWKMNIIVH